MRLRRDKSYEYLGKRSMNYHVEFSPDHRSVCIARARNGYNIGRGREILSAASTRDMLGGETTWKRPCFARFQYFSRAVGRVAGKMM